MGLAKHHIFKSSLFKQGSIYIVSDAINKAIPFLILPIIANYLLPNEYSIVSNYSILLTITSIFLALGTQTYINTIYYKTDKKEISLFIGNAVLMLFATSIVILAITFLFKEKILSYLDVGTEYLVLAVITASLSVISGIQTSIWRLERKATFFGIYQISQTAVNIVLSLALIVIYKYTWDGRIIGMIFTGVSYGVLSLFLLYRNGYLQFNYDKAKIKKLIQFGLPLVPHSLALWVRSSVDRVVVTHYCGHEINGIFSVGVQFGLIISFLIISFNNAYVPFLFKKINEPDKVVLQANNIQITKITRYYILIIAALCVLGSIASVLFVKYFMNANYQDAVQFIPWAFAQQFFIAIYLMFVSFLLNAGLTRKVALVTFSCALIHISLSLLLVKKLGAIGSSISSVIAVFINALWMFYLSNKVYPLPWKK